MLSVKCKCSVILVKCRKELRQLYYLYNKIQCYNHLCFKIKNKLILFPQQLKIAMPYMYMYSISNYNVLNFTFVFLDILDFVNNLK